MKNYFNLIVLLVLSTPAFAQGPFGSDEPVGGFVGNGAAEPAKKASDVAIEAIQMIERVDLKNLKRLPISSEAKQILKERHHELADALRPDRVQFMAVEDLPPIFVRGVDGLLEAKKFDVISYRDLKAIHFDKRQLRRLSQSDIILKLLQESVRMLPQSDLYPRGINHDRDELASEIANAILVLSDSSKDSLE